jgi:hypothetical protein
VKVNICQCRTHKKEVTNFNFIKDDGIENTLYFSEIKLHAHENQPLVLLEDLEDLTSSISCSDNGITLEFLDPMIAALATEAWEPLDPFVLITSHPQSGCNPHGERKPHL